MEVSWKPLRWLAGTIALQALTLTLAALLLIAIA
jgi:hypothetical protein